MNKNKIIGWSLVSIPLFVFLGIVVNDVGWIDMLKVVLGVLATVALCFAATCGIVILEDEYHGKK